MVKISPKNIFILMSFFISKWYMYCDSVVLAGEFSDVRKNVRVKRNILVVFKIADTVQCLNRCVSHGTCKAININIPKGLCELLAKSVTETHKESDGSIKKNAEEWIYYGPSNAPKKDDHVCLNYTEGFIQNQVCCLSGRIGKDCKQKVPSCLPTVGKLLGAYSIFVGLSLEYEMCYIKCLQKKINGYIVEALNWNSISSECFCIFGPFTEVVFEKHFRTCSFQIKEEKESNTIGQKEVPAESCKQLKNIFPRYKSGYYWITVFDKPYEVYCDMETDKGGWMMIGHVKTTLSSKFDSSTNENGWEIFNSSMQPSFFLAQRLMADLHFNLQFQEIRIKCTKAWHSRVVDLVLSGQDVIQKTFGVSSKIDFCKSVRFLRDDTSLFQGIDCGRYISFPDQSNLADHFIFVHSKIHIILTESRVECDDFDVGNGGFTNEGEWWFFVR